jgi:hypothetical protein
MNEQLQMTEAELLALPVAVDLTTAGRAFGLGRTKAFELARQGKFPVRVLRVGAKYRVPRTAILEALGVVSEAAPARPPRRPTQKRQVRAQTGLDPSPAA